MPDAIISCSECGSLTRPLICTREAGTARAGGRKSHYIYEYQATYVCDLCLMLNASQAECIYEKRRFTGVCVAIEGTTFAGYYGERCLCGKAKILSLDLCPSCFKESRMISKAEANGKRLMLEMRQLLKLLKDKKNVT